jgi:hypothetical protein
MLKEGGNLLRRLVGWSRRQARTDIQDVAEYGVRTFRNLGGFDRYDPRQLLELREGAAQVIKELKQDIHDLEGKISKLER